MNRIRQVEGEIYTEALGELPDRLRHLIGFDLFVGDASFAGVWSGDLAATEDPVVYRGHAAYVLWGRWHTRDKRTTIVVKPTRNMHGGLYTALHEIGHVLHGELHRRTGTWDVGMPLEPVSEYACTNYVETFAEAFATWFYLPRQVDAEPQNWSGWSRANAAYFDQLAVA